MATTKRRKTTAITPDSLQWLVDAYATNPQRVDSNQQVGGGFSMEDINPETLRTANTSVTDKPQSTGKYAFEAKIPGDNLGGGGKKGGIDLLNTGAQSLKYLVPAARLLSNEKKLKDLRKKSQLNLDKVQLMHGKVQDLQKPNFALRSRDPSGSSLAEIVAGQKFGDAQQRDAERNWEMQNSASRIEQQRAINAIVNQEALTNNQITNAGKQYNANMANNERFMRMNNQEELQLGLTETALNDVNQKNYLDATKESSAAADLLRYGDPNSEEYKRAQEYYMGVVGRNKAQTPRKEFGGKLKRKTKLSYV